MNKWITQFFIGFSICLIFVFNTLAREPSDIERKISLANQIINSDTQRSIEIVESLKNFQLTDSQRDELALVELRLILISGKYSAAEKLIAQLKARALKPTLMAKLYRLAIKLAQAREQYIEAFQYLNYIDQLPEDEIELADRVHILLVAAELNIDAGTFEASKVWLDKAIAIANQSIDLFIKCNVLDSHVYWLAKQEKYQRLEIVLGTAYKVCRQVDDVSSLSLFKVYESIINKDRGEVNRQQSLLREAIVMMGSMPDNFNIIQAKLLLAESYIKQGELEQGQELLTGLYDIFLEYEFNGELATMHRLASLAAEQSGNIGLAIEEYKRYLSFQQKFDDATNESQLVHLHAQYASSNNKLRNDLIELHLQRKASDKRLSIVKLLFISILAIISILLFFLAINGYMRRRRLDVVKLPDYDALTALPTRESVIEQLKQSVEEHSRGVVVGVIQIAQLDMVKQSFSIDHSDRLQAQVAAYLIKRLDSKTLLFCNDNESFAFFTERREWPIDIFGQQISTIDLNKTIVPHFSLNVVWQEFADTQLLDCSTLKLAFDELKLSLVHREPSQQGKVIRIDN